MTKNDGGPAYPVNYDANTDSFGRTYEGFSGMSLRDWFAGQALKGLLAECANPNSFGSWNMLDGIADKAWEAADAMLKARNKT